MHDVAIRKLNMFGRALNFGETNTDSFPPNSYAGELFAKLASVIKELSAHATAQGVGDSIVREGVNSKEVMREELRDDLVAIRRTAKAIAISITGFDDKFRIPRNFNDQLLLNVARAFAANAAPFVSEFVKRGMAANFLEELNINIELFEKANRDKNIGTESRVSATEAINQLTDKGMDLIKELDSIVKNIFSDDEAKLAAWESAIRLPRYRRSTDTETPPQT
jgi:hypothetical protein